MAVTIIILLFVLGSVFGSFGGVLISREWDNRGIKSIFFGRSKCEKCQKELSFIELIPFFSFLFQKCKCKTCKSSLSNFYRVVELLSGLVFVFTYLLLPFNGIAELVFRIIINWGFLFLTIFDIQKHELHFPIWVFVTIISIVFSIIKLDFVILIQSTLFFVFTFFIIYLFSKHYMKIRFNKKEEGFGQGDVYLSSTIGILSGFVFYYNDVVFGIINLIDLILIYVILSCVIGFIYSLISLVIKIKQKNIIPFLPSMILAYWIILLFGSSLIYILK